eukprot:m.118333 g.118333  ORF g.118333 m.118333 type:complete len:403 (+) comp16115_c0_seq2:474-1682(+)
MPTLLLLLLRELRLRSALRRRELRLRRTLRRALRRLPLLRRERPACIGRLDLALVQVVHRGAAARAGRPLEVVHRRDGLAEAGNVGHDADGVGVRAGQMLCADDGWHMQPLSRCLQGHCRHGARVVGGRLARQRTRLKGKDQVVQLAAVLPVLLKVVHADILRVDPVEQDVVRGLGRGAVLAWPLVKQLDVVEHDECPDHAEDRRRHAVHNVLHCRRPHGDLFAVLHEGQCELQVLLVLVICARRLVVAAEALAAENLQQVDEVEALRQVLHQILDGHVALVEVHIAPVDKGGVLDDLLRLLELVHGVLLPHSSYSYSSPSLTLCCTRSHHGLLPSLLAFSEQQHACGMSPSPCCRAGLFGLQAAIPQSSLTHTMLVYARQPCVSNTVSVASQLCVDRASLM